MKDKTALIIGAVFIAAVLLISWVIVATDEEPEYPGIPANIITTDKTALPDFVYNADSIRSNSLIGEKYLEPVSAKYSDVPGMSKSALLIVRGQISSLSYTFIDGQAWTQADIRLKDVLKGSGCRPGDLISVYYPGGYMSSEDYEQFTESGLPGSSSDFYRVTVKGQRPPQRGEDNLYFLTEPASELKLPDGANVLLCGPKSIFAVSQDSLSVSQGNAIYPYGDIKKQISLSQPAVP